MQTFVQDRRLILGVSATESVGAIRLIMSYKLNERRIYCYTRISAYGIRPSMLFPGAASRHFVPNLFVPRRFVPQESLALALTLTLTLALYPKL